MKLDSWYQCASTNADFPTTRSCSTYILPFALSPLACAYGDDLEAGWLAARGRRTSFCEQSPLCSAANQNMERAGGGGGGETGRCCRFHRERQGGGVSPAACLCGLTNCCDSITNDSILETPDRYSFVHFSASSAPLPGTHYCE